MYVLFCSLHFQCEKLGKLDVTCGVILDDDGKGTMDVFGHPEFNREEFFRISQTESKKTPT